MTDANSPPYVTFHSPSLEQAGLSPYVVKMEGKESLSGLYRFELLLQFDLPHGLDDDDVTALLDGPARIVIHGLADKRIHGMIAEIEQLPYEDPTPVLYRVVLVPRIWRLTQRVGSWVYQNLKISEIFTGILKEIGLKPDEDFSIALSGGFAPAPDYAVQYQESDFQFMSRWMEALGIFYYFTQGDDAERLVITDQNATAQPLDPATLEYNPNPSGAAVDQCVLSVARVRKPFPKNFVLTDYDWSQPTVSVKGSTTLANPGGKDDTVAQFGARIDSVGIQLLTQRRAERALCERETFQFRSHHFGAAPGSTFTLSGHPSDTFDDTYLITEVTHSVVQIPPTLATEPANSPRIGFCAVPANSVAYANQFSAQRSSVPYRPALVTPRPRIHGTTLGRIDGASMAEMAAPMDEWGRYKVTMFYDQAPDSGGSASCWIRMVQRAAGLAYGDHARLHVGTEVLISYLDGDPDRPVIVGALTHGGATSPVVRVNATQDVFRTRAGGEIVFEDDASSTGQWTAPPGQPKHTTS